MYIDIYVGQSWDDARKTITDARIACAAYLDIKNPGIGIVHLSSNQEDTRYDPHYLRENAKGYRLLVSDPRGSMHGYLISGDI